MACAAVDEPPQKASGVVGLREDGLELAPPQRLLEQAGSVKDVVPRRRGVERPAAVPGVDLGHQVHRLALHPPVRPVHLRRLAVKVRGLAIQAGVVDPDGV